MGKGQQRSLAAGAGDVIKNTASQKIGAGLVSATDGSDFTSTVTVYVTIDAGTQAIGTVGSGICTHEGKGYHTYAPSQAETNGDLLGFSFTGTGAITATVQVLTIAGDAFNRLGAPAGASVSADVAAVKVDTAASLVDTAEIGVAGAGLTNINLPNQTMDIVGNITGNVSGSVGSVVGAVGSIAAGGIDSASFASQAITNGALATNAISASKLAADASAEIAGAVWDEDATGHQTTGTFGQAIGDPVADTNTIFKAVVTDAAGATVGVDIVAVKVDTAATLVDTAEIGAAGAGLTAVPWNASWDAEVQSEVDDGLVARALDHLLNASVTGTDVADNSIFARLVSKSVTADWDSYANTTDALEAIRDNMGTAQTGDGFARLGAPAGASVSADIAAVKVDTAATLVDTGTTLDSRIPAALVGGRMASNAEVVGDKTGYSVAAGGIISGAHAAAELNAIADALLDRNMTTGTDSGTDSTVVRTVRQALRRLRNREGIAGGVGTVYKEDDSAASWTYAATTTAGNPLSEINPT